ncbi:unnamed protein product [Somion occarium]|uniref:Uncharacterized protein n=1 Tax=Somion occarium TaxID=3059160 RepID=A0ABP1DPN6_9APHY
MGKADKAFKTFVNNIPNDKLTSLPDATQTLYRDVDFRLDMQGMTADKPPRHNLQVQINNSTTISTLKKQAPKTVSMYHASKSDTPAVIRQGLLDGTNVPS